MSLLEITNLTHSFGDQILYRSASVALNRGEHIGVVGQNGSGKSTLIKICTGQIVPDEGQLSWQPGTKAGYLDQYADIDRQITLEDFLKTAYCGLYELEEKMMALYQAIAEGELHHLKTAARYQEQLEQSDFYSIDTQIDRVAGGLGLLAIGLSRPLGQMSGGQRAKVILAKLLLEQPDVLILDEPTNFLDKEHVAWLADYLSALDKAYLVVSHDYEFLEKISNRIIDIDNKTLSKYYGTYSEFLKKKTHLRADYVRQYTSQQREIKKTEDFIRRNMAGRKSKMARGRKKQLENMDKMEALDLKEIRPHFSFQDLPLTNADHLVVSNLSVGYKDPVLTELGFTVKGGQKAVITGFNGIGKSTLLKTLMGKLPELGGWFHFSEQVKVGYFEQDLIWGDETETPLQIVSAYKPSLTIKEARRHLARCGISGDHAAQAVGTLSGGEQAKVKLCLLMLNPCNFLIMDEPTNHLDIQAKAALNAALKEFGGTLLLVSHEEEFYRDIVQTVIGVGATSLHSEGSLLSI